MNIRLSRQFFIVTVLFTLAWAGSGLAQPAVLSVENGYVRALVNSRSGQFAVESKEGYPLSYRGANEWNSHTVFYLLATGSDAYFTNQVSKENPARKDFAGKQSVLFFPDSCYVIGDTVRTVWTNMRSFRVLQNLYPIETPSGGQIVIQYSVQARDENTSNHFKGIFLELDLSVHTPTTGDNCQLNEDKPLVLTSIAYDAIPSASVCWKGVERRYKDSTGMPDWFVAGLRFPDFGPTGTLVGKGVLTGKGLTAPNEFYVSDWGATSNGLKDSAWNFEFLDQRRGYADAAVGYKWRMDIVGTSAPRVIATSYGMNDHQAGFSICQEKLMTMVAVSPHEHFRDVNGTWDSLNTIVDVYVANVDHQMRATTRDTLIIKMTGAPEFLVPSPTRQFPVIPGTQSANLGGGQVGHARWVLKIDTNKARANQDFVENLSFRVTTSNIPEMNTDCDNVSSIHLHGYVPDNTPPTVAIVSNTRTSRQWELRDGGSGNTGIDSVTVVANANFQYAPPSFLRCDTSEKPRATVLVRDTTKSARFVFRVVDCAGNFVTDSMTFTPFTGGIADGSTPLTSAIAVFPNPLSRDAQVLSDGRARGLRVVNAFGQDVTALVMAEHVGDGVVTFDASHLAAGVYHVIAEVLGLMSRTRFVVVH
jgi:hypothetical protein